MIDGGETGAGLTQEALYLGRLVMNMLPDQPEPRGLMALMLYCEARRGARRSSTGAYVALGDQDRNLWSAELVIEAETHLSRAASAGLFGRFQTEAAIQSVHMQTAQGEPPNAPTLVALYYLLVERRPSIGALVGRALAQASHHGSSVGLRLLGEIPAEHVATYQSFWAAKLHLLQQVGDVDVNECLKTALALATDLAARIYLSTKYGTSS